MVAQVYRARPVRRSPEGEGGKPRSSPLWQCPTRHFDRFQAVYEERYRSRHGFLRPIIPEVVNKFLDCGDLEHGFARIRCDHCQKDHLLAFSCKGRWWRLPRIVSAGLWCGAPPATRKRSSSSEP